MAGKRKSTKTPHRVKPIKVPVVVDRMLDPLVRMMELRTNLRQEQIQQEVALLRPGVMLPIRATRRALMLERAMARERERLLSLPL